MLSTTALVILLPLVYSHDIAIGLNSYGKKFFDENRQASPAIWRQKENVTIQAGDNEVISKVLVIDKRPEKDGDAKIIEGGENKKNVTIELKSPTVFRGYDFHIEAYAVPATHVLHNNIGEDTQTNITRDTNTSTNKSTEFTDSTFDDIRDPRNLMNENQLTSNNNGVTTSTMANSKMAELNFPGMSVIDKDDTVHIRKIGDDLTTTNSDMLTSTVADSTTDNTIDTTTGSEISTTTLNEEPASPDKNGKDIPYFDDLLSTDKDESRFVRQTKHELELSTMSDVSTTETGETTTVSGTTEISDVSNYTDIRESRQAKYNESNTNDNTKTTLQIIIENGAMSVATMKTEDNENNANEGSGSADTSTHTNEDDDIIITSTEISILNTEEQLRNARGVSDADPHNENLPNFPVFVDQSLIEKSSVVTDDYVYVPIVAVISKHNYPLFQGVIDTYSKNDALPKLDINAINGNIKYDEIPANVPVISYM